MGLDRLANGAGWSSRFPVPPAQFMIRADFRPRGHRLRAATGVFSWLPYGSALGFSTDLLGVSTISATDAWAVGEFGNRSGSFTLMLHWNGTNWTRF
jgi:hypothetical protein